MFALEKEEARNIAGIITSEYYKERVAYLKRALQASRNQKCRSNSDQLLAIQLAMAKFQSNLWSAIREGRKTIKQLKDQGGTDNDAEIAGFEQKVTIHQQLIKISKSICDGIAWRTLKYNRLFILSSSRNYGTGAIDTNALDFKSEFAWAFDISRHFKSTVLINDITNFLRIGDLTEYQDGTIFIHEIKKLGKAVKNMFTLSKIRGKAKLSNQSKRLVELQRIALRDLVATDIGTVNHPKFNIPIKTYNSDIKSLIKTSKISIFAEKNITPFLRVSVKNILAADTTNQIEKLSSRTSNDNQETDDLVLIHSNWDSFYSDEQGNFIRLAVPYSIYPYSNEDCIRLMSGQYLLVSELNLNRLKIEFRKLGWEIIDTQEENVDRVIEEYKNIKETIFTGKLYQHLPSEPGLFTLKKGPFHFPFTSALAIKISLEFISFETIEKLINAVYLRGLKLQTTQLIMPELSREIYLWN